MPILPEDLAIETRDLGKRFGSHWVLAHLDLTVKRGESVALFGKNGSGKSTFLKILATLLSPSTGSLRILGYDREKREIRKKIRLLAHEKQLYGTLTVMENLKLASGIRGVGSIDGLLERFRLEECRDKRVDRLSEGMKKRVVLARLLIGSDDADLILLDEPHPTLDAEGRRVLDGLILEWRKKGKTILLASHDHELALTHVDRLIVLEEGSIRYDGPPKGFPLT